MSDFNDKTEKMIVFYLFIFVFASFPYIYLICENGVYVYVYIWFDNISTCSTILSQNMFQIGKMKSKIKQKIHPMNVHNNMDIRTYKTQQFTESST